MAPTRLHRLGQPVADGAAKATAWESGLRFLNPAPIAFDWALFVAVIGLIVNGVSALLLTAPRSVV